MRYGKMIDPGAFWWEEVAGPARLVEEIEAALADGASVVCQMSASMSFRREFRAMIEHWLSFRDIMAVSIDCAGVEAGSDQTAFLLRQLQPNLLNDYRRRRSARYLQEKDLLRGKLLWLHGLPAEQLQIWVDYLCQWDSGGLFLVEAEREYPVEVSGAVKVFDDCSYIRKDDLRLYASVLAEHYLDEPAGVKQYAVELAAALCVTDGELAETLVRQWTLAREDPVALLRRLADPANREPWHPFSLLQTGDEASLRYRIWSAQVRVGYPRIELERLHLIRRWYQEIREALQTPYRNEYNGTAQRFCTYDGEPIEDPYELEIGVLVRLSSLRRFDDTTQRLFRIPDPRSRDRLYLLRDCRNNLAHMDICEPEVFYELVSKE